jgi:hypothetical protein
MLFNKSKDAEAVKAQ